MKKKKSNSPVRSIRLIQNTSGDKYTNRILIGTPTLGVVRMEWATARYGMTIPTNWSAAHVTQFLNPVVPIRFSVADGQNLIINFAIAKDYEWVLLIEDDTIPSADALIRFNKYMRDESYPMVSGLYYTKNDPAEPMIYRGRGTSYYSKWKLGDLVHCDGVPTGMLLLHMGLVKKIWDDSPEYLVQGQKIRRVFENPLKEWYNQETGEFASTTGTTDLDFCSRIIEGGYLKKSGWDKFAKMKYPFVVDTNIQCMQVDLDGQQYPLGGIEAWCANNKNL